MYARAKLNVILPVKGMRVNLIVLAGIGVNSSRMFYVSIFVHCKGNFGNSKDMHYLDITFLTHWVYINFLIGVVHCPTSFHSLRPFVLPFSSNKGYHGNFKDSVVVRH